MKTVPLIVACPLCKNATTRDVVVDDATDLPLAHLCACDRCSVPMELVGNAPAPVIDRDALLTELEGLDARRARIRALLGDAPESTAPAPSSPPPSDAPPAPVEVTTDTPPAPVEGIPTAPVEMQPSSDHPIRDAMATFFGFVER